MAQYKTQPYPVIKIGSIMFIKLFVLCILGLIKYARNTLLNLYKDYASASAFRFSTRALYLALSSAKSAPSRVVIT